MNRSAHHHRFSGHLFSTPANSNSRSLEPFSIPPKGSSYRESTVLTKPSTNHFLHPYYLLLTCFFLILLFFFFRQEDKLSFQCIVTWLVEVSGCMDFQVPHTGM